MGTFRQESSEFVVFFPSYEEEVEAGDGRVFGVEAAARAGLQGCTSAG